MIIDNSLYDTADEEVKKIENQQGGGTYVRDERLLNCKGTRVIYFRLIPRLYMEENEAGEEKLKMQTYLPYRVNTIKSTKTKKNVYAGTNPSCKGEPDFWRERQQELWDRKDLNRAKLCYATDKRLMNVFVIKDTGAEEGEEKFRVWDTTAKPTDDDRPKAGSPLMKELKKIAENEDLPVTSANIYSLGEDGITFKMTIIEPKTRGDFTDVTVDSYQAGTTVQGFKGFPKDKLGKIYLDKTYDLNEFLTDPKSTASLWDIFNEHVMGASTQSSTQNTDDLLGASYDTTDDEPVVDGDDIPFNFDKSADTEAEKPAEKPAEQQAVTGDELEDDIAKMLADIE